MTYTKSGWMVVKTHNGVPVTLGLAGQLQIFTTRKQAKLIADGWWSVDVVKVTLHYEWEWLPKVAGGAR